MAIIAEKHNFTKLFYLHLFINGKGDEFLDFNLPYPTYQKHTTRGYYIAWALNGYFGTKKNSDYLKDIKLRLLETFKAYKPDLCPFRPNIEDNQAKTFLNAYELKLFANNLASIKKISDFNLNMDSYKDSVFWKLKIYAEILIKNNGIFGYEQLLDFGESNCQDDVKDYSTLKAKCKSIWHYYNSKDFEIGRKKSLKTEEEIRMTRQEIAKQNTKIKVARNRAKVFQVAEMLKLQNELFKPNGKPNIKKVCDITVLAHRTVKKYLEEGNYY